MAVLAGIDEAGFGPLIGPLVVSSSAFSVPDDLLSKNLWQVLRKSVAARRTGLAGRLLINDSKKAFTRSSGIGQLQRTVLACLKCTGKEPASLVELLSFLCPDYIEQLDNYPWYKSVSDHQLSFNQADVAIASGVFENNMSENNIRLLELKSACLDVEQYNNMVANIKNKSNVLFGVTCQLIQAILDGNSDKLVHIIIDRQGGRMRYRRNLQLMFEGTELTILKENETLSSYELKSGNRILRLHFVVGADRKYLPVSLASMASKLLRELMIENINRYFEGFCSELKPTAGYWKDGLRFIQDLKTLAPQATFDANQLIRCR